MEWYADWLTQLRFGDSGVREPVRSRLAEYAEFTPADRRLHFTNVLVASCRKAGYAPLVLFRLFPLSVRVATSVAFADQLAAAEVRNQQIDFLPGIADCHDCHGRPLENGEMCKMCGKPVWTHTWMTAVD